MTTCTLTGDVLRLEDDLRGALASLLARFGLQLELTADEREIPGSFWGDEEAGLMGDRLFVRRDTPLHSALHEACHFICMDPARRAGLHTDAGSDDLEECAVCYLQILLGEQLAHISRQRLFQDMDRWGYSFRLGSTEAWFTGDAEDAREWLLAHGLIDATGSLTWDINRV